ncbi:DUF1624 domain-containing protein [Colwellia sp. RE-S-Sl-9]
MTINNTQVNTTIQSSQSDTIKKRIASIDILRGFVMLLMLVDHVRERFFYHQNVTDPMTLNETSTELFFTRMTAHLCAPVFVFLTGLSAWLYAHPHNNPTRSASSFLFKRGLFIIFIECTLINFSWFGTYNILYLQVMWAIGVSMIVLSLAVKMNIKLIAFMGLAIIFGHNALTPISFAPDEFGYTLWTILHDRGYLISDGLVKVKASYPVLPWIGVICLGYFAGPLYSQAISSTKRQKTLFVAGFSALILLIILRGFNLYGETLDWTTGINTIETIKSFVNYSKYPPSLNYLLLTLGIAWLLLGCLENVDNKYSKVVESFGAAPMFFYIVHLYILLIGYRIFYTLVGPNNGDILGFNFVWQIWAAALLLAVLLYFPTKAFSLYKKRTTQWWVKYL